MTRTSLPQHPSEWPSFAPALRLDSESNIDRHIVEHFGEILSRVEPHRLQPPRSARRRNQQANAVLNFQRWCAIEGVFGGDPAAMTTSELRTAVRIWLAWRLKDISPDHPLTVKSAQARGESSAGCRLPGQCQSVGELYAAVETWATDCGLGSVVSAESKLLCKVVTKPRRPSHALSDDEIVRVVTALRAGSFHVADPDRSEGWHARQLATFNVCVAGSLRPGELPLLTEHNLVSVSPEAVEVRLPRTKQNPEGRLVSLHARSDLLCPVWALDRWLTVCRRLGWDRDGVLLPGVLRIGSRPLSVPSRNNTYTTWQFIVSSLGLAAGRELPFRHTPHGLRAMSLTRAADAGWDPMELRKLGGWATLDAALRYDRGVGAPAPFTEAMAFSLSSSDAGEVLP